MMEEKIYREFESIVGPENINGGVVITTGYAFNWFQEVYNSVSDDSPSQFSEIPLAILLPSTTEEVQGIVKLCNKHDIQFKAQSTGLGPWNQPSTDNCIIIDLRRMDNIVKIDKKNLYAVIEPYVTGAQLQIEVMKFGLNCHMPGAGSQVSPLASHTSMAGPGFTSPSTGHSARNVLGVEWVLPDGVLMRLGSWGLKKNSGWYNGDGPGPSLRGIMRGWIGAKSGIGIFTRVAVKLFPYPCSTEYKIKGRSPNYDFEIPDYLKLYIFDCMSYKLLEKVMLNVEKEEIAFMCSYMSSLAIMAIFADSLEALLDKLALGALKAPLVVLIGARTKREFEYKKKVMSFLMEEDKIINIIGTKFNPKPIFYAEALRSNLGLHGFIATGGFMSSGGSSDTLSLTLKANKSNINLKKKYIKKGVLANDFGEGAWGTTYEHGHYAHMEFPTMYDQTDTYSIEGMADYVEVSNKVHLVRNLGAPFFVEGTEMHEFFGPYMMDYHKWLRKIKETFDPNNVADSGFYISPKKRTFNDFKNEMKKKLRRWQHESSNFDGNKQFEPLKVNPARNIRSFGKAFEFLVNILRPRKKSSRILLLPPKKQKKN